MLGDLVLALGVAMQAALGLGFLLIIVAGGATLLRAGRVEADGYRQAARDLSYQGGLMLAFSAFPIGTLTAFASWVISGITGEPEVLLRLAGIALAGSGASGLLAGLSRKPRPTGTLAVGCLACAVLLAIRPLCMTLAYLVRLASELD